MSTDGYTNDTENATVTTTTTPSEFEGREVNHKALWLVFVPCAWMQSVVGSIGTLMVLVLICMQPKISNHELFIANLATTDLITLAYWWPFFCLDLVLGHHPVLNMTHCRINGFLITLMSEVYVVTLIFVSFNRYMHVCHHIRYIRIFTERRRKQMIAGIWLSGFGFGTLPYFFKSSPYCYEPEARNCTMAHDMDVINWLLKFLYVVAPLTLIGYLNFAIYRFWSQTNKQLMEEYARESAEFRSSRASSWAETDMSKATRSTAGDLLERKVNGDGVSMIKEVDEVSNPVKDASVTLQPVEIAVKEDGLIAVKSSEQIDGNVAVVTLGVIPASNTSVLAGKGGSFHCDPMPAGEMSSKDEKDSSFHSDLQPASPSREQPTSMNPRFLSAKTKKKKPASKKYNNDGNKSSDDYHLMPAKVVSTSHGKESSTDLIPPVSDMSKLSVSSVIPQNVTSSSMLGEIKIGTSTDLTVLECKESPVDIQRPKIETKQKGESVTLGQENVVSSSQPMTAEPSTYSSVPASGMLNKEGTEDGVRFSITPAMSDSTKDVNRSVTKYYPISAVEGSKRTSLDNPSACIRDSTAAVEGETEEANYKVSSFRPKIESNNFSRDRKLDSLTVDFSIYQQMSLKRKVKQKSQNRSVVRSLLIVYLMTCLSFAPYGITVIVDAIIGVPTELMVSVHLLHYMNNASNWILYGCMNPAFRRRCSQLIISVRRLVLR